MTYPLISFVQTAHNERTLVLTFATMQDATNEYNLLTENNLRVTTDKNSHVVLSITKADSSVLNVVMLKPIQDYKNYEWLLNKKLTHITTNWADESSQYPLRPEKLNF